MPRERDRKGRRERRAGRREGEVEKKAPAQASRKRREGTPQREQRIHPSGSSLRVKFAAIVAIIILWIMGGFGFLTFRQMKASHIELLERQGYVVVTSLAAIGREFVDFHKVDRQSLLDGSKEHERKRMCDYLKDVLSYHHETKAGDLHPAPAVNVEIIPPTPEGTSGSRLPASPIAAAKETEGYTLRLARTSKLLTIETDAGPFRTDVEITKGTVIEGDRSQSVRRFVKPIRDEQGTLLASAVLMLSESRIQEALGHLRTFFLVGTLVAVGIGMTVAIILAARVSQPIGFLVQDMAVVGQGDLDHSTLAHSRDEIGVLARTFNEMTKKLKVAHQAEIANRALEYELTIARDIQNTLLPKVIPEVSGFDMEGFYRPAKEVGGDYYDFIDIDEERLGIVVADVSGKGIPGSMVMTQVRSILRMAAAASPTCHAALVQTNAIISREIRQGMFVTVLYAILNRRDRTLTVCSAGHNPLVLCRPGNGRPGGEEVKLVNPRGIAIGFDRGEVFSATLAEEIVELAPGDRVVLYTDGVVEAMNEKNEEFGDERFRALVQGCGDCSSREFVKGLVGELDTHRGSAPPHDDITVVTFRLMPETARTAPAGGRAADAAAGAGRGARRRT
jgi:serine phosphatase RsbU (regulator of sigma subunit)